MSRINIDCINLTITKRLKKKMETNEEPAFLKLPLP